MTLKKLRVSLSAIAENESLSYRSLDLSRDEVRHDGREFTRSQWLRRSVRSFQTPCP
jgi:hypothetical protein